MDAIDEERDSIRKDQTTSRLELENSRRELAAQNLSAPARFELRNIIEGMEGYLEYLDTELEELDIRVEAYQAPRAADEPDQTASKDSEIVRNMRRYLERYEGGTGVVSHSQAVTVEAMQGIVDGGQVAWAPSDRKTPPADDTCPVCKHATHGTGICYNMASDNDCACKGPRQ